jgi:hypothetical protein
VHARILGTGGAVERMGFSPEGGETVTGIIAYERHRGGMHGCEEEGEEQ